MLDSSQFIELKASGKLPSPAGAALKIIELCQRDNVTLPDIIKVLQTDPAMVGRILKIANSASFVRHRPQVALTTDVLMSIGVKTLRQLVLAFSVVSGNHKGDVPNFDYDLFWSRSVAMGVGTQLLGEATQVAPAAEMFTVGLLSNVGQLAIATMHPEKYGAMIVQAGGQFSPELAQLEEAEFGYSHWEVSAAMMLDWGLPKLFSNAVLNHTNPQSAESKSRSEKLSSCIALAAGMADLCFMSEDMRDEGNEKLLLLATSLGLPDDILISTRERYLHEWKEWSSLLELSPREAGVFKQLGQELKARTSVIKEQEEKIKILVVDDDKTICLLLQKFLESLGHSVAIANDGHQGLALALEFKPHIVITDIMMPNRDGLQLIKSLRETDMGRFFYIIVLTMLDDKDKLAEAFTLGADDYVSKPVDKKILQARLMGGVRIIREQQDLRRELGDLQHRLLELSIANQQAQQDALTDSLTGLFNRRHAMERLSQEWSSSARSNQPLSLLMIDIDHFKEINDAYGHDMGDMVLRQFANILRERGRVADIPCRIGGERFLILAPGTNLDGAKRLAERIRNSVQEKTITLSEGELRLMVSIGVAEKSASFENVDELMKAVDQALHQARKAGRNGIESADK